MSDCATIDQTILNASRGQDHELGNLLFGFVALSVVDLLVDVWGSSQTLLGFVWSLGQWQRALVLGALGLFVHVVKACWFPGYERDWIRFRPLAQVLTAEAAAKQANLGELNVPAYRRRNHS